MAEKLFCSNCGTQLAEGSLFCHKCGAKVLTVPDEKALAAADSMLEESITPVDKTISMTTILKEMEALTRDETPSAPKKSEIERPTVVTDIPRADSSPKAAAPAGEDDPWPWEIPAFTNTEEQHVVTETEQAVPAPEPVIREEAIEQVSTPKTRAERKKAEFRDTEPDDPYTDRTGVVQATGTVPPSRRAKVDYIDEEDYEDEYDRPRRWPFVLLGIIIAIALCGILLYFFKPNALNRGIDFFNRVAHTDIAHVTAREPKATATPAPTPEPTPEATAEPEPEVSAPVEVTQTDSPDNYLEIVTTHFVTEYYAYLNAMNNNTLDSLDHVSEELRASLKERYETTNKNYTFANNQLFLDPGTYKVYESGEEGTYDINFFVQAFNDCHDKDGNAVDNTPIMDVVIRYTPATDDWTLTRLKINNQANVDPNAFVQIFE